MSRSWRLRVLDTFPFSTIMFVFRRYSSILEEKADKAISRGEPNIGVSFVNFKEDKFSYLNITILGYSHVDWMHQCSFTCLETPTCFSYNLAAYPDINGKLLCELLPSDKYNNSDKFVSRKSFHHFSITVCRVYWTFLAYTVFLARLILQKVVLNNISLYKKAIKCFKTYQKLKS